MKIKLLSFLMLFTSIIYSQNIDINKIDDYINYIEKNNQDIGSLSIFKDGKEVYNRSFGQKNVTDLVFNKDTKYQIGSISKLFTATLIFQLIEKGKLNLNDKLSGFYPQIPNAEKITIKNLLEHSSGLGDYAIVENNPTWLTKKVDEKTIIDEIIKQGVSFEPNEKTQYSNSGYYLLSRILEKKYNSNYYSILENNIIKPLKLKNINSYNLKNSNFFKSYGFSNNWEEIKEFEFSNVIGLGDIIATTETLNIFINNLFQYKILKKETIENMKPTKVKEAFGKGIMLIPFYKNISYGHGGDTYGTHSVVSYDEKSKISISYSINGERFLHNDFAIGLLSIIYNKDYKYPVFIKSIMLKSEDLDKYLGVYSTESFPLKLTISKEGNVLKAQGTGQPSFPLECYEINKFKFDQAQLKIEFVTTESKLIIDQGGNIIELKKE